MPDYSDADYAIRFDNNDCVYTLFGTKTPSIKQFNDAGFTINEDGCVQCLYCHFIRVANVWLPQWTDPWAVHVQEEPQCPWVMWKHQHIAYQQQQKAKQQKELETQRRLDDERREQQRLERKKLLDEQEIARQQVKMEQQRLKENQEMERQLAEQKARDEAFACRRCPAKYPSNTKLHAHIAERHIKKAPSSAAQLSPTEPPASTLPTATPATPHTPPTPPTPPASISSATSKLSYAAVAKTTKLALPTPPATPPATSKSTTPQTSYAKIAKSSIKATPIRKACTKPKVCNYMTMEDLFRKFAPHPTPLPQAPAKSVPIRSKKQSLQKALKPHPGLTRLSCKASGKIATHFSTSPPTPQPVKTTPPTWPSGVVSQHEAIQHPHLTALTPVWEWTSQYGLRLRAWVMV